MHVIGKTNMKVIPVLLCHNRQSILEDITYLQDKDYDFVELRLDYYEHIEDRHQVIDLLKDVKDVVTPRELDGTKCIYHQYTIEIPNRDAVHKYLQENLLQ